LRLEDFNRYEISIFIYPLKNTILSRLVYIFLVLFGLYTSVLAQNPVYRTVNNLNGLPSNTVYDMMQDSTGFIWVAHNKGLSRYDGKSFVNFKNTATQGKAFSNLMLHQKKVWCQDFSGNFYYTSKDSVLKENHLRSIGFYSFSMMSDKQELASVNQDSFRLFDLKTKQTKGFLLEKGNSFLVKMPTGIHIFNNNKLYNSEGKIINQDTKVPLNIIFHLKSMGNNVYGITKNTYPYIYPLFENQLPKNLLRPGLFIQAVHTYEDEIWICTSTGAYCFDQKFEPKYNGFCFFEGTSISKVMRDREGNYWFSTLNRGLSFLADFFLIIVQRLLLWVLMKPKINF
jgi:ligand-binding sensor domain-containing protein